MTAVVARVSEREVGRPYQEAGSAREVVVDGHELDLDVPAADAAPIGHRCSGRLPPAEVAGAHGGRPKLIHLGGVVEGHFGRQEPNQGGVVEVEVTDEDAGAAVPSLPALIDTVQPRSLADRDKVF